MGLTGRFSGAIRAMAGGWREAGAGAPAGPSGTAGLREAAGATIDEDRGWRRLTGGAMRDIPEFKLERMRELALFLWRTNMLANRLIELPLAYLLAEGVRLQAADPEVQGWLDAFWDDAINAMDLKLEKKMREHHIYGEQCWPVFVNAVSGAIRLGYIDPAEIDEVVTDPDNAEQPIGVITRANGANRKRRYRIIVLGPETVFAPAAQALRAEFTDGDCFYFALNSLSNGVRGVSDLLAAADWLSLYEEGMFGEIERVDLSKRFIWDVTMKGATKEEVEARARSIATPKAASVRVHNDAEEWDAVAPDLKAADATELMRLFRNHILGGGTIPEHWYGGAADVNRATGDSMGDPTIKILTRRQRYWMVVLVMVASYVVWRRLDPAGAGDPKEFLADPDFRPRAVFPELTSKDTASFATALTQVVSAASVAVTSGLLSEETALTLIALVAGQLGVEIDPKAELEAARAEADQRRQQDVFTAPPADPAADSGAASDNAVPAAGSGDGHG
jgi:hypothetical protein